MATKDFVTYTPSTGNGNATISVQANVNQEVIRSTNLTISGNGISKSVNITQNGIDTMGKVVLYTIDTKGNLLRFKDGQVELRLIFEKQSNLVGRMDIALRVDPNVGIVTLPLEGRWPTFQDESYDNITISAQDVRVLNFIDKEDKYLTSAYIRVQIDTTKGMGKDEQRLVEQSNHILIPTNIPYFVMRENYLTINWSSARIGIYIVEDI